MTPQIRKYPRTPHLEGSRLGPGDDDVPRVPLADFAGVTVVIEEKVDGANTAISFAPDGQLRLQSRGHFLTGGGRERHFDLFKTWAETHQDGLRAALGTHRILYGEWLFAKHTVFYDRLPHYFVEFDVLDTRDEVFLSTERRQELLEGLPVVSAPVIFQGPAPANVKALEALVRPSLYKSEGWRARLSAAARERSLDEARVIRETDLSDLAEGLYLKVERDGAVVTRAKYVRSSFLQAVEAAEGHWLARPILPNELAPGVDLFRETA
jgi:hypothetical protein